MKPGTLLRQTFANTGINCIQLGTCTLSSFAMNFGGFSPSCFQPLPRTFGEWISPHPVGGACLFLVRCDLGRSWTCSRESRRHRSLPLLSTLTVADRGNAYEGDGVSGSLHIHILLRISQNHTCAFLLPFRTSRLVLIPKNKSL